MASDLQMKEIVTIKRALISVADKTGLAELAQSLIKHDVEILSTGGTAKFLQESKIPVKEVSDYTGFPEMMDGRVKTLHPKIHGGLLALRDKPSHIKSMEVHNIEAIDLVVVNLYPFEAAVRLGQNIESIIENIDIGGPAIIRSAAKNHASVTVLVDPSDYKLFVDELVSHQGATSISFRKAMAAKAYGRTSAYDAAIANWLTQQTSIEFPEYFSLAGKKIEMLRYGENPHQRAAIYRCGESVQPGIVNAKLIQGKELSYNNLNDADAAFELISEFNEESPAVVIVKHTNPCGVATGRTLLEAYQKALRCDPVSAFGGVIAVNTLLDEETADSISKIFTEVVIAPATSQKAKTIFASKKNLRLLETATLADPMAQDFSVKTFSGGFLVQSRDNARIEKKNLKFVTKRLPDAKEMADLLFAFRVCKHIKSNAVVYAKDGATVGIGAGQMSRLDSARIAAWKAIDAARACGHNQPLTKNSVVASDAFFPFADGLIATIEAGATAVIQPGGSLRDQEVIEAADERGVAMVFTGVRHFRH